MSWAEASVVRPWEQPGAIGAFLSKDRVHRYALWRNWDTTLPKVLYVMLNPSVADEQVNDPTIVRCCERARINGFGGILVGNLFAFRATDPVDMMMSAQDPVGPENDIWLELLAKHAAKVVCGWGTSGGFRLRDRRVRALLSGFGPVHHLGLTKDGHPRHPLYVSYKTEFQEWR